MTKTVAQIVSHIPGGGTGSNATKATKRDRYEALAWYHKDESTQYNPRRPYGLGNRYFWQFHRDCSASYFRQMRAIEG
jgi:hypothetical protein|tara:strand:- start:488 stop:721 length:234 start_codon:yes stop_codon:yes gene_type:complete